MPRDRPAPTIEGMSRHGTRRRGREQRRLERIEQPLVAGNPRLASMFAIFTTMTRHEPMPVTERLSSRPRRFLRR
jgi:hypothetical protein